MKTNSYHARRSNAGFTLVESMITVSLVTLTAGMALSTFVYALKCMYRDGQRLATNSTLRYFTGHVAKETLDSTEFHLFPRYSTIDGSVNIDTDVSPQVVADYGTEVSYGDCLVLVTRTTIAETSPIRQFRVYYRVVGNANGSGSIRYYEGTDYGNGGTTQSIAQLLNTINLQSNPTLGRQLVATARGLPIRAAGNHSTIGVRLPAARARTRQTPTLYFPARHPLPLR
jgi:prepilin-type N-terminal cleavage/methylation domain-containing protein